MVNVETVKERWNSCEWKKAVCRINLEIVIVVIKARRRGKERTEWAASGSKREIVGGGHVKG